MNKINPEYVAQRQLERKNRITQYATANNCAEIAAAMFVDANGPITTNQKMLKAAGFDVDVVTIENYKEVIDALEGINVNLITDNCSPERIVFTLNNIITEEITECWGGPDMKEYIECFPNTESVSVC